MAGDWTDDEAGKIAALMPHAPIDTAEARAGIAYLLRQAYARGRADAEADTAAPFQARVQPWMIACFGAEIADDKQERNHRFLEEALELVQACGATRSEAHQLVDYVYNRPVGEPKQEVGGVMVTLAALCLAHGMDMHAAGETELARVWTKVEAIRAKQAAKPRGSALPQYVPDTTARVEAAARAIYDARHDGLSNCYPWDDTDLDHDHPDYRANVYRDARAALEAVAQMLEGRVLQKPAASEGGE